ncbi:MAG: hypothetical protein IJW62_00365 [Clostridia bacterium]|nr:hypothetical protein [Clostridia bacterium]
MQKEILTPSRCKEDVLQMISHKQRRNLFLGVLVTILFAAIAAGILLQSGSRMALIVGIVVLIFALLIAVKVAIPTIRNAGLRRRIRRGDWEIREDLLTVRLAEWTKGARGVPGMYVYSLRFEHSGEYRIPPHPHYEWSEVRKMLPREVHDTATDGDQFYLICLKDAPQKTPLMVYNQKFFILCEEGTTRAHTSWRDSVNLE